MIRDVSIENYKSISKLTFELGRVNLLIGANGCGKSNILEAIIFGSAAASGKLDNELLANRGIRISDPKLVRCGFDKANLDQPIRLEFSSDDGSRYPVALESADDVYSGWTNLSTLARNASHGDRLFTRFVESFLGTAFHDFNHLSHIDDIDKEQKKMVAFLTEGNAPAINTVKELVADWSTENAQALVKQLVSRARMELGGFLTYAPQISTLRQLQLDSHIEPLGLHGEGLFRLLQVQEEEGGLDEINQAIEAIDWFDGLALSGNGSPGNRSIRIVDRYMDPEISGLDHLSANEGFLFVLFHVALLISRHTPRFFAVENVDESLNPRLCIHLIKTIARLSAQHEKQVILTTHNPTALDGLDLDDDEQRLFVVYRNADGHTRVRRILASDIKNKEGGEVRLSEAFIRGYLGGLPSNF